MRKLIRVAAKEGWITTDPTSLVAFRATKTRDDKPWTDADHEKYCAAHPIGTTARTVYGLARWLGNRRGDITKLRWADRATVRLRINGEIVLRDGFFVDHEKNAERRRRENKAPKRVFQPMTPMLAEILAPLDKTTEFVLTKRNKKPYHKGSLTVSMRCHWIVKAKLTKGHTLHGLRFALGATLAEAEVDTKGRMEVLGHDNAAMAEHYGKGADQARMAIRAMDKVIEFVQPTTVTKFRRKKAG